VLIVKIERRASGMTKLFIPKRPNRSTAVDEEDDEDE
jgi:hypothetical protein